MDINSKLLVTAENLFYRHGFTATGMDKLTQAVGVSSRTIYKHAGSKNSLFTKVLAERNKRFFQQLDVSSVKELFKALENWVRVEDGRGCLFLRAHGETGGDIPEIAEAIEAHKRELRQKIKVIVTAEVGAKKQQLLTEQILILFEGATAAAVYRGAGAVAAASKAAQTLIEQAQL